MKKTLALLRLTGILAIGIGCESAKAITYYDSSCLATSMATCSQTIESIRFSNFTLSGLAPGPSDEIFLQLEVPDGSNATNLFAKGLAGSVLYNFGIPLASPTTAVFSYTVTLPSPERQAIQFGTAQGFVNSGTSTRPGNSLTAALTSPAMLGTSTSTKTNPEGNIVPLAKGIYSQTFTHTFSLNPGTGGALPLRLNYFSSRFETVPAPLPLIGAGFALASLRKLKQKSDGLHRQHAAEY